MRGIWIVPIIASILILGTLGLTQDVFAPPSQKAEKIKVDSIDWDTESQSFVLAVQIHHGIAKAVQNNGLTISAELIITDPLSPDTEEKETYDIDIEPFDLNFNHGDPIEFELNLQWDRIIENESFEGEANVSLTMRLISTSDYGTGHSGVIIDDFSVDVEPLPECTSDSECSEGEICDPFSASCVEELACKSDVECAEDELCTGGLCLSVQGCNSDSDCPAGTFCVGNVCYLEPACTDDDECSEGEFCDAGFCQSFECVSDVDCSEGFVCQANRCVLGEFCIDDSDCTGGKECINFVCTVPTPTENS